MSKPKHIFETARPPTPAPEPTADQIQVIVTEQWKAIKPNEVAQAIRASLRFDSGKYKEPEADYFPDYLWDVVDIAVQTALNAEAALLAKVAEALKLTLEQSKDMDNWHNDGIASPPTKAGQEALAAYEKAKPHA